MVIDILKTFEDINLLQDSLISWFTIQAYQKEVAFEILSMGKNVVLDMRDNRNMENLDDCKQLLTKLQNLSKGAFVFSGVNIQWVTPESHLLITFEANSKSYQAPVFISEKSRRPIGIEYLLRVINQSLVDAGNSDRFHFVIVVSREHSSVGGVAAIFLSPEQRKVILEKNLLSLPFVEQEENPWTLEQTLGLASVLSDLGLLSFLSKVQVERIIHELYIDEVPDAFSVLLAIPGLTFCFDFERIYDPIDEAYNELMLDVCKFSNGLLKPEKYQFSIIEKENPNDLRDLIISFDIEQETYTHKFLDCGDYANTSFINLFNKALEARGAEKKYYGVESDSQLVVLMFLTDNQYQGLRGLGLFDFYEFKE